MQQNGGYEECACLFNGAYVLPRTINRRRQASDGIASTVRDETGCIGKIYVGQWGRPLSAIECRRTETDIFASTLVNSCCIHPVAMPEVDA